MILLRQFSDKCRLPRQRQQILVARHQIFAKEQILLFQLP